MRSGAPSSRSTRSTSSWASRSWICSARPSRLAISMCARNDSSCARAARGRRGRCGTGPARSRRRRAPAGGAASARSRRAPSSSAPAARQPRRLVGVQRDAADQLGDRSTAPTRPAGGLEVAADLHRPRHAGPLGREQQRGDGGVVGLVVEVGVAVDDAPTADRRAGLGQRRADVRVRPALALGHGSARRRPARSRSASQPRAAPRRRRDGSSLGTPASAGRTGVPATTGTDSHARCRRVVAGEHRVVAGPSVEVVDLARSRGIGPSTPVPPSSSCTAARCAAGTGQQRVAVADAPARRRAAPCPSGSRSARP